MRMLLKIIELSPASPYESRDTESHQIVMSDTVGRGESVRTCKLPKSAEVARSSNGQVKAAGDAPLGKKFVGIAMLAVEW